MRMFIAVEIAEPLRRRLQSICQRLAVRLQEQTDPTPLRWVGPGKYHLTLRFLGETTPDQQQVLDTSLAALAAEMTPFSLALDGLGAFPNWRKMRVLWVGVAGDVCALHRLQTGVENRVRECGFAAERQAFHPHMTLARARRGADRAHIAQAGVFLSAQTPLARSLGQWKVSELVLMRSDLQPGGAVYTAQGRYPLGG